MAETVPLLDHIKALIDAADKRYQQRFDATEEAIRKAETATEKRLEGMNEFRKTLSDQARDFVPRSEYSIAREANLDRFGKIESRLDLNSGRGAGIQQSWLVLVGAVTLAAIIGGMLAKHF